jgi:site-specific recombinase XerD
MRSDERSGSDGPSEPVGDLVRIFRRGNTWYANFQHEGRQRRQSLKTRSKKEARRLAIQLEAEILQSRFRAAIDPSPIASVVRSYLEYLDTERRAKKTLAKYGAVFDRVLAVAARRDARHIDEVNLKFVDTYRRDRVAAGAAPKTVYTETVVIRQPVNFALSREMLAVDPLKGLRLAKPRPTVQPCWTKVEVDGILSASREPQRSMFALLAETGMRVGELKHLLWDDVDLERGFFHVRPKDGWKPKTGDQRAIPISRAAREALMRRTPRVTDRFQNVVCCGR